MPLTIQRQDITKLKVDAIVNAANAALAPGGGVCGAIFAAAGYEEMDQACRKLGGCPTGQSVLTPGFSLPAKYVVHTVGPIWRGGGQGRQPICTAVIPQPSGWPGRTAVVPWPFR